MKIIQDHLDECDSLNRFLESLDSQIWQQETPFKRWSVNQVIQHLYFFDLVAMISIQHSNQFSKKLTELTTSENISRLTGHRLLQQWQQGYLQLNNLFSQYDSQEKLPWFGPPMKPESLITARQMEVWAHGQDIYDLCKTHRRNDDRVANICTLGVKTFSWSFQNRSLPVPDTKPSIYLTLPSGKSWQKPGCTLNTVRGDAVEFCQVVSQCRHILDTRLQVEGEVAQQWMDIAQCFAGKPEQHPKPGARVF